MPRLMGDYVGAHVRGASDDNVNGAVDEQVNGAECLRRTDQG
jgi:hypothetical protein